MQCPKCLYVRSKDDRMTPDGICPSCGIAYAKWNPPGPEDEAEQPEVYLDDEKQTLLQIIKGWIFEVPDRVDPVVFWGRAIVFIGFFVWGWWFISTGGSWVKVGSSFLHNVNLPFHEFGHVFFSPLGRFMGILGGSLFQIMVPLIFMGYFIRQRDNFEAAIMLWWVGQNFIDLSPYIADAEYRAIPLIMGLGESAHDWGNLLTMMGMVDQAYYLGRMSFLLGSAIIIASFAWGGYVLYLQKQNSTDF